MSTKRKTYSADFKAKLVLEVYTTPRESNNFFKSLILKRVKLNNKRRG